MKSQRIILRPWKESDADVLFEYAKDPVIGRNCGWPPHKSAEESRDSIRTVLSAPETYAVVLRETGEPVGSIALKAPNAYCGGIEPRSVEMGFWIGVPYWGKGLIREAADMLLDRAFRELHMKTVWCGYYAGNERSKRVQEKIGFRPHHCEKMAVNTLGEYVDTYFSCITQVDRIKDFLALHADEKYKEFSLRLLPGMDADHLIGVRLPELRKLAKRIGPDASFLHSLPHASHEENLLHAFLISQLNDYAACTAEIDRFLPYVDNWAVCDGLSPKCFRDGDDQLFRYAKQLIRSAEPFTIRFGYRILMKHFIKEAFRARHLDLIAGTAVDHYYVRMGIAWYLAEAMVDHFEDVYRFLKEDCKDDEVKKYSIRKGIESYRVSDENKARLRSL